MIRCDVCRGPGPLRGLTQILVADGSAGERPEHVAASGEVCSDCIRQLHAAAIAGGVAGVVLRSAKLVLPSVMPAGLPAGPADDDEFQTGTLTQGTGMSALWGTALYERKRADMRCCDICTQPANREFTVLIESPEPPEPLKDRLPPIQLHRAGDICGKCLDRLAGIPAAGKARALLESIRDDFQDE